MNINIQTKMINTVLVLTGIFLIVFSFQRLNQKNNQTINSLKKIGAIESFQNDIRLKSGNAFQWLSINKPKIEITQNDKIFSNNNSSASIRMDIGHSIGLGPDTLIRLKSSRTIKVDKGVISLSLTQSKEPIIIDFGAQKIKITPLKDSKVTISNNKKSQIKVEKGSIHIKNKQEEVTLETSQKITVSTSEELHKTQLIFPIDIVLTTKNDTYQVKFKLENHITNDPIILSKDHNFKQLIPTNNMDVTLTPGLYYWKTKTSKSEYFKIIKILPAPSILSPKHNETFFTFKKTISLQVKIKKGFPAYKQKLQLFDLNKKLIQEKTTLNNVLSLDNIEIGKYFIGSRYFGEFYQSPASPLINLQVLEGEFSNKNVLVIELKKPNQRVKFQWEKAPKDLSLFELSDDPNFSKIIISKRIRSKDFTHITFPKLGKFYWRSQKLEDDGTKTFQAPIQVIIRPTPAPRKPKALPNLNFKIKSIQKSSSFLKKLMNIILPSAHAAEVQDIHIKFPKINNAKFYEIEIYSNLELTKKIKSIRTKTSHFIWVKPPPGLYYWRIRFTDHWDRKSDFSDISKLNVEFEKAPPNKRPKTNKTIKKVVIKKTPLNKVANTTKFRKNISLLIGPNTISYQQSLNKKIEISGSTYNSWELEFQKQIDYYLFNNIEVNYHTNSGKVFTNQNFNLRKLELIGQTNFFNLAPIAMVKQFSTYQFNSNSQVKNHKLKTLASIGASAQKTLKMGKSQEVQGSLSIYTLNTNDYKFGLNYYYHYKNHIKLALKSSLLSSQISLSDSEVKYQYFQLLAGLKLYF